MVPLQECSSATVSSHLAIAKSSAKRLLPTIRGKVMFSVVSIILLLSHNALVQAGRRPLPLSLSGRKEVSSKDQPQRIR